VHVAVAAARDRSPRHGREQATGTGAAPATRD
jgi:hypothetical protein